MGYCLELKNISFSYGRTPVLSGISFSVSCGDYVGIVGPNGGGKTTLLKIILGLEKPDSGEIRLFGHDSKECECKHTMGYVPQRAASMSMNFPATVEEVVQSGRVATRGLFKNFQKKDYEATEHAMELVGVKNLQKEKINNLSGGQKQRVYIARALAGDPQILILDEPATAIDLTAKESLYKLLSKLNKDFCITIVLVSHDIDVVSREAKTVVCLNHTLVCNGAVHILKTSGTLDKLYGERMQRVHHSHEYA